MSLSITEDQRKTIFKLIPLPLKTSKDQRSTMIYRYTNDQDRKSVNDLTFDEANQVILNYGGKAFKYDNWAFFDAKNSQHRKILSLCLELEWSVYNTDKKQFLADLKTLSEFLKSKRSPVKKPLKKMNSEELSKVIHALEQIFSKSF